MKPPVKILLLGASSYLGAKLYEDLSPSFDLTGTYFSNKLRQDFIQLDLTNSEQIKKVFQDIKPEIIIHVANYPSARNAINNKDAFRKLNLKAIQDIVMLANQINAKLIFISSYAALNPDNIYGQLKLESEQIVKNTHSGYLILRPSVLFGVSPNTSSDSTFNKIIHSIKKPDLATFDTSWNFQPTYLGHISNVIKTAIDQNIFDQKVHLFCSDVKNRFQVATDILKPLGVAVKPIDEKRDLPLQKRDESELIKLDLPTCKYEEMMRSIYQELHKKFNNSLIKFFDLVDKNDKWIGVAPIVECHSNPQLIHRVVHFTVIDSLNKKILITKRSSTVKFDSGMWCFMGDHLHLGEDYNAAVFRGLDEELGFRPFYGILEKCNSIFYQEKQAEFARFFVAYYNQEQLNPNPKEISSIKWISLTELLKQKSSYSQMTQYWIENVGWVDVLNN